MSTWRAATKLTLSLRVLGTRADGFHDIDALTVSVSEPHDEVTVAVGDSAVAARLPASARRVRLDLTGPATAGVTASDNLATRAVLLMREQVDDPRLADVSLVVHKQIPAGAGLGGGSADAAAILVALDHLLELALPSDELAALGASLGSDVPFCVHGGAAHMRGRGERIEPATLPRLHVLIAVPPFAIGTPWVYQAWDALGGPESTRVVTGPAGIGPLTNDLEPAAEHVEPRLREFRERLEQAAGGEAILAGSGSACVVLCESADGARAAQERVAAAGIAAYCAVGVSGGPGVERTG